MAINSILVIAHRDLMKLLRDPIRLVSTFIMPMLLIGVFGGIMQANLAQGIGFDYISFTFTGVFAQTLFFSTAMGLLSLIEDRENDFSQTIFVSPVSRYTIVIGKIIGESLVALPQGIAILVFGLVIGITITWQQIIALAAATVVICLLGGAFGIFALSNISNRRAASELFTYVMIPQYFLAGVFTPIRELPGYLEFLSRISPMRYAVDLARNAFYYNHPDSNYVVLETAPSNLSILVAMFIIFLVTGTFMFVRKERNR